MPILDKTGIQQNNIIMRHLRTKQNYLGEIVLPNPEAGNLKLNVFPFLHNQGKIKLPYHYKPYESILNKIMKYIPVQEEAAEHYVTIDSQFFSEADCHRRPGVHIDGNFCADPHFKGATWGGTEVQTSWGGTKCEAKADGELKITTKWLNEQGLIPPIGTFVSDNLGGTVVVSNEIGCKMWGGDFKGIVGNEGDFSSMSEQLTEDRARVLKSNELWLISSNTPHETLVIEKGKRRTFLRVTLNHRYRNEDLFTA